MFTKKKKTKFTKTNIKTEHDKSIVKLSNYYYCRW